MLPDGCASCIRKGIFQVIILIFWRERTEIGNFAFITQSPLMEKRFNLPLFLFIKPDCAQKRALVLYLLDLPCKNIGLLFRRKSGYNIIEFHWLVTVISPCEVSLL